MMEQSPVCLRARYVILYVSMPTLSQRESALIKQTVLWRGILERNVRGQSKSTARSIALCIVEGLIFLNQARRLGMERPSVEPLHYRPDERLLALRNSFSDAAKKYHSTVFALPEFSVSTRFEGALEKVARKISALRGRKMSPGILGKIYETDSDGSRKGVYVTPDFISDYIVDRTLAPLLRHGRKSPNVLDPACGAGAFPLKIFDQLIRSGGGKKMSMQKRRRLLACVHGVDIDSFGVELTKLSMLLKLHEGTGARNSGDIPELSRNFRCADALLTPHRGGFDAVIVNPPHLSIRDLTRDCGTKHRRRLARKFICARGAYHLYVLFVERSLQLMRARGRLGIIVPSTWAIKGAALPCRKLIISKTGVESVADISQMCVFSKTNVYPHILIAENSPPSAEHRIRVVEAFSQADLKPDAAKTWLRQQSLNYARGFQIHAD